MNRLLSIGVVTLMLGVVVVAFAGCGNSEYESTDEFLENLPAGEPDEKEMSGTLPPMGESIDKVAKIRLETDEFDMGVIDHDKLAHDKIKVFNDGDMRLKITRVDTTCACTQGGVTPETAVVPPGGSSWIDVVVDPRRIPGFYSRKVLTITSTDIDNPQVEVAVVANVDPEYEIDSNEFDLGDIPKGETFEKRIRFRQLVDDPIEKVDFLFIPSGAMAGVEPDTETRVEPVPEDEWKTPGRKELDLVVQFKPFMAAGEFVRHAYLNASIRGGMNRNRMEFKGTVVAPYQAEPRYPAKAEAGGGGKAGAYHARVTVSAATPVTVGEIRPGDSTISAAASPGSNPNEVYVDLTYTGPAPGTTAIYKAVHADIIVGGKTYPEMMGLFMPPTRRGAAGDGHNHDH